MNPASDVETARTQLSASARKPARSVSGERPAPLPMVERPAPLPMAPVGSQTQELQAALTRSRRRLPVIVVVVVVLLAAAAGVWRWYTTRTPVADPAVVAADEAALELLKKDDRDSLLKAIAAWEELEKKAPDYVPAKANRMIAHVLLTQDLRDELSRLKAAEQAASKEMAQIKDKKATPDWVNRANAKREEIVKIKAQFDPLVEKASEHDGKAGELLKASKKLVESSKLDGAAVFRASAIYYGIKGNESAEKLAQTYRVSPDERGVLHDEKRAFADLAIAAQMAQGRISGEMRDAGLKACATALKNDPKLLRAHLLEAKIHFAARELEPAKQVLTEMLVLNPAHAAAAALRDDIALAEEQAKKLAEKKAEAEAAAAAAEGE